MTEFITRNYGNESFEVIIKTDSKEHYKATQDFARRLIDHAKPMTIQRWIPVTERLPEDDIPSARYLCYANGYVRILKYWRMYKSFEYGGKPIKVTHWMPLPEPPKGDD